jgi:hypothetical protein
MPRGIAPATVASLAFLLLMGCSSSGEPSPNQTEGGGSSSPDSNVVRYVSPSEWGQAQVDCLKAAGYAVTLTSDGEGVDYSKLPASQQSAMEDTQAKCLEQ